MLKVTKENYSPIIKIAQEGGLIAFPTETVYGFGVVYNNKEAYDHLIEVKRRPPEKPFTMMLGSKDDIAKYAYVDERAKVIIDKFVPGEITLILKAKEDLPSYVVSKEGMVGIRVPNDKFVLEMITKIGVPLLVPSANRSGEKPLNKGEEVALMFENEIDAVVMGESTSTIPSTIVLIDENVSIIREGRLAKEIQEVIEKL